MADTTPDISLESILRQLTAQAEARWGADYVDRNRALLELAAEYATLVSNNLPDTETEPGFYQ